MDVRDLYNLIKMHNLCYSCHLVLVNWKNVKDLFLSRVLYLCLFSHSVYIEYQCTVVRDVEDMSTCYISALYSCSLS